MKVLDLSLCRLVCQEWSTAEQLARAKEIYEFLPFREGSWLIASYDVNETWVPIKDFNISTHFTRPYGHFFTGQPMTNYVVPDVDLVKALFSYLRNPVDCLALHT